MVECLQTHDYDAESPEGREIAPGFRHPSDDWKTLSVSPAVNGYLFKSGKDKAAKGEGFAQPFISLPKIQWDSNPHCPNGYQAMGNLYL